VLIIAPLQGARNETKQWEKTFSRANKRFVLLNSWSDDSPLFREDSSIGFLSKERNMSMLWSCLAITFTFSSVFLVDILTNG
jgi:hypothetical protein